MTMLDEKSLVPLVAEIAQVNDAQVEPERWFIEYMNSLLLVEVRTRVERLAGVMISDRDWGKIRSVRELAAYLATKQKA